MQGRHTGKIRPTLRIFFCACAVADPEQVVQRYKKRYGRDPPPAFDRWLAFARQRGCTVEGFEQIDIDLAPFRDKNGMTGTGGCLAARMERTGVGGGSSPGGEEGFWRIHAGAGTKKYNRPGPLQRQKQHCRYANVCLCGCGWVWHIKYEAVVSVGGVGGVTELKGRGGRLNIRPGQARPGRLR